MKFFDSGVNDRDIHVRGYKSGLYLLIEVKATTAKIRNNPIPKSVMRDLEISFAGKKVKYPKMSVNVLVWKTDEAHLNGNIILSLKAFDNMPPVFW